MVDKKYILTLADELKAVNAKRNNLHKRYLRWVTRDVEISIPENFKNAEGYNVTQQVPNFVGEFHDRVSALLAATPPLAHVVPLGSAQKYLKQSTLMEKWCNAALVRMSRRKPLYSTFCDSFSKYGMAVAKVIVDRHAWGDVKRLDDENAEEYNERRKSHKRMHFPFEMEIVHPSSYYPVGNGEREVLIITKRRARLVALQYGLEPRNGKLVKPEDLGPKGPDGDWPSTVDFLEYWNEDEVQYIVDETIVERKEHDYGRPPFFSAYARPSIEAKPEERSRSYLDNLIPVTESMAVLMTTLFSWMLLNGFPSFYLSPKIEFPEPLDQMGAEPVAILKPGAAAKIPHGYALEQIAAGNIGNISEPLINFLVSQYRESSLAQVLTGESPGADMSGTALTTIIAVAKSIFAPGLKDIESAFSDIAKFMLQRIELSFKEPVPIRVTSGPKEEWIDIGPSEIGGYFDVDYQVEPVVPAELYQRYMMVGDAFARGAATLRELIEARGVENPDEIMVELLADKYTAMPQFQNVVLQRFIESLVGEDTWEPGTPPEMPVGPGGPAAPVVAGIQQPIMPGAGMPPR